MAPRRYVSPERGAQLLGITASRWRQIRTERPDTFPDHHIEIGDPADLDNPSRRVKRGYDAEQVELFRRHLKDGAPPPPRRDGPPQRFVSARVFADQLGLSLTRIAQLAQAPTGDFPAPAVVIENPDGETCGWDQTATRTYLAHRQQRPPRPGRPPASDPYQSEGPP